MITKFELFINESKNYDDEKLIRMMAWLYMFLVYKSDGLKEKSWFYDIRMGIKFKDSISYLKDNNFIRIKNDKWLITKKGENELYSFFDVPKNREEYITYNSKLLLKYDIDGLFHISKIPKELYEIYKRENKDKIKYNLQNEVYEKINVWLEKYQRGTVGWINSLTKYCGLKENLLPNVEKMTLYRGINLNKYKCINLNKFKVESIKVGDEIICNNPSWTLNLKVAESFACGKQGLDDHIKMHEDEIGVILKHEFNYTDLFIDTNWVNDNHDFFLDKILFSTEYEVINE